MMTASTTPQQILDVDNWLFANPGLSGTALTDAAQQQGFDPAFIALVNFPQVLEMMAQHIDDYSAIGEAFTRDQGAVTDSIQRVRAQAYAAGSLRSNAQQTVEVQQAPSQTIYVIQPANPQVVYVPQYDPTVVYVRPRGAIAATPLITFGAGITIGALLVNQPWGWSGWAWNWRARRVYYNNVVWGGWGRQSGQDRAGLRERHRAAALRHSLPRSQILGAEEIGDRSRRSRRLRRSIRRIQPRNRPRIPQANPLFMNTFRLRLLRQPDELRFCDRRGLRI